VSTLVVIGYDDRYKAEEVRLRLRRMRKDHLIDLEDAVAAVKDEKGKITLHQAIDPRGAGPAGGFWGSLIGLIFLSPILDLVQSAPSGAVSDRLAEVGVDDNFVRALAAVMKPGSSTLFVLARRSTPDQLIEEMKGTGGTILKTSLAHEDETRLQAALHGGR
jgi:uncharacterized membrane protein